MAEGPPDSHEAMNNREINPITKTRQKRSYEFLMGLINNNSRYQVTRNEPAINLSTKQAVRMVLFSFCLIYFRDLEALRSNGFRIKFRWSPWLTMAVENFTVGPWEGLMGWMAGWYWLLRRKGAWKFCVGCGWEMWENWDYEIEKISEGMVGWISKCRFSGTVNST